MFADFMTYFEEILRKIIETLETFLRNYQFSIKFIEI